MVEQVFTSKAPRPVGPYSQAVKAGKTLYVSGMVPIDPETGKIVGGDVRSQVRRVLENIKAVLEEAGYSLRDVVRVGVYLRNPEDFKAMNEVYEEYFRDIKPARTTVVASPPIKEALVEIEVVAYRD